MLEFPPLHDIKKMTAVKAVSFISHRKHDPILTHDVCQTTREFCLYSSAQDCDLKCMWQLQKNLSYKNPLLICYKNLVNGSTNMSKPNWHWTNEVAAAISAGLISVCRSSCQAASQWKGGFDILAVKGGFDILAVFFSLRWAEWVVRREKECQLLPVIAQEPLQVPSAHSVQGHHQCSHLELSKHRGNLMAASHHSIYLPDKGKRDNSQVPGPFRKHPLFSSVQMSKRDLQQMMCLWAVTTSSSYWPGGSSFRASLEFFEYLGMKWT